MESTFNKTPTAHGRTADVYDWDESHVLKLFHNWFSLEDIEYELRIARAVHVSGVKAPAVKELIQVDGRNGLIYERAYGESMLVMFQHKPWKVFEYARILAKLHADMHNCVFKADVPAQHPKLKYKLDHARALPESLKTSLLNVLGALPEGNRVCHGDFHPANVLLSENEATVIDWIDASCGNPLADVARTSIITLGAVATPQIPNPMLKVFINIFHSAYLREYFRLRPQGREEYHRWLPIVAGARLSENIPELERWLIQQAGK